MIMILIIINNLKDKPTSPGDYTVVLPFWHRSGGVKAASSQCVTAGPERGHNTTVLPL